MSWWKQVAGDSVKVNEDVQDDTQIPPEVKKAIGAVLGKFSGGVILLTNGHMEPSAASGPGCNAVIEIKGAKILLP